MRTTMPYFKQLALAAVLLALPRVGLANPYPYHAVTPGGVDAENTTGAGFYSPFDNNGRTYQMQIAASRVPFESGEQLTALRMRLHHMNAAWSGVLDFTSYDITLAQAANAVGSMSITFAQNLSNPVVVRSGRLILDAADFPSGGTVSNPNDWGPTVVFDTPYTYAGGDLIITLRHSGSGHAERRQMDGAHSSTGTPGWGTDYRGYIGLSYDATTAEPVSGTNYDRVVVFTQFEVIPEPSTVSLLLLPGVAFVVRRRRLRAQASR